MCIVCAGQPVDSGPRLRLELLLLLLRHFERAAAAVVGDAQACWCWRGCSFGWRCGCSGWWRSSTEEQRAHEGEEQATGRHGQCRDGQGAAGAVSALQQQVRLKHHLRDTQRR